MLSNSSNFFLTGNPALYPPSDPSEFITLWQGTIIGTGFEPFALPTARTESFLPILSASVLYAMAFP